MTEELIPLNLLIADRTYRIRIDPKDEEVVRKTAKTINDKLVEFKTAFGKGYAGLYCYGIDLVCYGPKCSYYKRSKPRSCR